MENTMETEYTQAPKIMGQVMQEVYRDLDTVRWQCSYNYGMLEINVHSNICDEDRGNFSTVYFNGVKLFTRLKCHTPQSAINAIVGDLDQLENLLKNCGFCIK